MSAAFTSLATAAALVVPLAAPAAADHTADALEVTGGDDDANPDGATNTHTFTVQATDNGVPQDGIVVSFEVISGPNVDDDNNGATRDDFCTTNSTAPNNGECQITYADDATGDPGTDTVRFWVDHDGDNRFDQGEDEVTTTSTKTWFGPPASASITPTSDSAAVGACNSFTVTIEDAEGNPVKDETVNIIRNHDATAANDAALTFCDDTEVDGPNPSDVDETTITPDEGDDEGETDLSTDANGQISFGVESTVEGTEQIRVFVDTGGAADDLDAGEPTAVATKTWTEGGADGVTTLNAEPESEENFLSEDHEITVAATNASGDGVPGVTVRYTVDSGPNAGDNTVDDTGDTGDPGVWCITGNDGTCSDTYSSATAGTDQLTFWVNQTDGGTTGRDATEPSDTVTKTWVEGPQNVDIDVTCDDTNGRTDGTQSAEADNCTNPTDSNTETFTATVTDDTGGDAPREGLEVEFTVTDGDDPEDVTFTGGTGEGTDATATCTTDADGQCSVTLNNPTPQDGDSVDVQGRVLGTMVVDTSTKTWEERDASFVEIAPATDTNQIGGSHTVTITVLDQFGAPVSGETVDAEVLVGRNVGQSDYDQTTDANGQVTFTYQDSGAPADTTDTNDDGVGDDDDDLIGAWVDTDDDDNPNSPFSLASKFWVAGSTTAAEVAVDLDTDDGDGVGDDADPSLASDDFGVDEEEASPGDVTWDWDAEAPEANLVTDTGMHRVVASAQNEDGAVLRGKSITFTVSGVGELVDADGDSLGTSTDVTVNQAGYAVVWLQSTEAGEQTVTASADGQSDAGTKDWHADNARHIELTPANAVNAPGTIHEVTATVTDRFGNPVQGIDVDFTESGPGAFRNGINSGTTDASGQVTVETTTAESESGTQTITGTIDETDTDVNAQGTECDLDADDPAGAEAGNCSDTATKRWVEVEQLNKVDPNPTVTAGDVVCLEFRAVDGNGDPVEGVTVRVELTGANENANLTVTTGPCTTGVNQSAVGEATTDANGIVSASYTATNAGTDTLEGWADLDGDNVQDTNEPSAIYTITVEGAQQPGDEGDAIRLALTGGDRHDTAVAISQDLFPTAESLTNVVLARSTDYADALSGTPLAVQKGAPMLLTPDPANTPLAWDLHPKTEEEIDRLLTPNTGDTVWILGGEAAVGADVELLLESKGYTVERLAGTGRFETAVEIADEITGGATPASIFITTGQNFPDALTAGAAAVEANGVIVLTDNDNQVSTTTTYLQQNSGATEYAVGGPAARAYDAFVAESNELVGAGRYETAMIVVEAFWPNAHPQVGVARGDKFPDGLSGGTHIGHLGGPLLLTTPDRLLAAGDSTRWDDQSPKEYLENHAATIDTAYAYGGTAAISATALNQIEAAITE